MSRPTGDTAELVRRTLRTVAEALPVEDRELPDEARPPLLPAADRAGGDRPGGDRRLGGHRRRRPGRRPLVAAAATALVVAGVWATRLADEDDVRTDDPATSTVPVGDGPAAGWLPERIDPTPSDRGDAIGAATPIEAVVLTGPDEDDVIAAAIVAHGGIDAAQALGDELAPMIGAGPDGVEATVTVDGTGAVVVSRDPSAAAPVETAMGTNGAPLAELAPDGWATAPLPLDWLPRTGVGRWTAYGEAGAGPAVELHAAAATLPETDALEAVLQGEERVTVHGRPAWAGSAGDGDGDGDDAGEEGGLAWVVWQESPGVTATVLGTGVPVDDLVRVGEESAMPSYVPPPGPEAGPDAAGNRVMEDGSDWALLLSIEDAARLATALPEVTEDERHGDRTWNVGGKGFAWERHVQQGGHPPVRGETPPEGPIVAVRVEDLSEKEAVLEANPDVFFTIPHFDGYAAVLIQLDVVSEAAPREAFVDGWLACAPQHLAEAFLERERPGDQP
jgi:hypothetical protein